MHGSGTLEEASNKDPDAAYDAARLDLSGPAKMELDPVEFGGKCMKNTRLVTFVVAAGALLAACSGSYDRQELIDELQEDGTFDEATAICIVEGLEEQIGEDRLNQRFSELTGEEEAIATDIALECFLGS